jgi:hypothetical protein
VTPRPGINQEDAEAAVPFERTLDRSTIEQLFSAAADSGSIPDDPRRPRLTRRQLRRRLIGISVVLAVVLGAAGAGWAWTNHAAKQPALKALGVGNKAFEPAVEKLRLASDLEQVRSAATEANAAADRVDSAGRSIAKPSTDLERRVLTVLRGETELLRATAAMATLDLDSLDQWPAMRTRVADAEADLESDVRRLGNLDADAGRSIRMGHALAVRTDEMVGDYAETTAIERLGEHLGGLTRAVTTRQVRDAAQITDSGDVVAQVLAGVDRSSPQGTQVVSISDTLEVIGRLTKLDGGHLALWKPIRADLVSASDDLDGVDTASAVAAVDALVTGAETKLRAWRTAKGMAVARTQRDTERANDYLEAVRPVLQVFDAVTKRSAEFSRRVQRGEKGGVTYPDAAAFLDQTRKDLTWVETALTDTTKLPRLRKEHVAVVDSVDFAATAVLNGYEGIGRPRGCITRPPKRPADPKAPAPEPVCYYSGSPGWVAYSLGWAQAVQSFTTARTALDEAAREHLAAIESRELPKKPVV